MMENRSQVHGRVAFAKHAVLIAGMSLVLVGCFGTDSDDGDDASSSSANGTSSSSVNGSLSSSVVVSSSSSANGSSSSSAEGSSSSFVAVSSSSSVVVSSSSSTLVLSSSSVVISSSSNNVPSFPLIPDTVRTNVQSPQDIASPYQSSFPVYVNGYDSNSTYYIEFVGIQNPSQTYKIRLDTVVIVPDFGFAGPVKPIADVIFYFDNSDSLDIKSDYYTAKLVDSTRNLKFDVRDWNYAKVSQFYNSKGSDFFALTQFENLSYQKVDTIYSDSAFNVRPTPNLTLASTITLYFYDLSTNAPLDTLTSNGASGQTTDGVTRWYLVKYNALNTNDEFTLPSGTYRVRGTSTYTTNLSPADTVTFVRR